MHTPSLQLLPKSTASILGTLVVYSGIPLMQSLSSWLWGCNSLLLRLHWEISLSLLCSPSSWGSALVLAPLLCIGSTQVSFPWPDSGWLRQRLIRPVFLTQPGELNSTEIVLGMWVEPVAAEATMMLQQPGVCSVFSQGSCPWILGPWKWCAAQAPGWGGRVWVVICPCTQDFWWQWQQH